MEDGTIRLCVWVAAALGMPSLVPYGNGRCMTKYVGACQPSNKARSHRKPDTTMVKLENCWNRGKA